MSEFGILVSAYDVPSTWRARALARSLRTHAAGVPLALAATAAVPARDGRDFDIVVEAQEEAFGGQFRFFNKLVTIVAASPFRKGLHLDDDVLAVRPLGDVGALFAGRPFAFNCTHRPANAATAGTNHVDPRAVASEFGLSAVIDPEGGGHLYFELPACRRYFLEAIDLVLHERPLYERLTGSSFVGDEPALAIVANRHQLPMPSLPGWIEGLTYADADTIELDVAAGRYRNPRRIHPWADDDVRLVHFCAAAKRSVGYRRAARTLAGEEPAAGGGAVRRTVDALRRGLGR